MGIFQAMPRSVQAMAEGATVVLEIPADGLMALMTGDPRDARDLMAIVVGAVSERLRRANNQLLTLFQVGRLLGQASDLDLVVHPVLELLLAGITEAEGALLWLVNEVSGELELHGLTYRHGTPHTLNALEDRMPADRPALSLGDPLVRLLDRTDGALELTALPPGSMLRDWLGGSPKMLIAPLRARAAVDGALILIDWTTEVSFAPSDADLLASIAAQLEGTIERLRHLQEQQDRLRLEQEYF
jgi:nitrate/nitrite-specific signal transduction histidine kinase